MDSAPAPTATQTRAAPHARVTRWLLVLFGVWCGALTFFVAAAQRNTTDTATRAMLTMILGVLVLWVLGGGLLSLAARRPLRAWAERHRAGWRLRFVLLATALALLEEVVTVTMTDLGPRWGAAFDQAHITASANYLDVVLLHSVIVFVPMFIVWAWLLTRYAFAPAAVLLLYGTTGFLAEAFTFHASVIALGMWIYVYGLMIYLPATLAPADRAARAPRLGAVLLAIVLPFVAAIPVALVVQAVHSIFFRGLP